ncbi:type II toxin-antitoxin system RelE/ParE family toxin [Micromonospora sp. C32]|nr:type II toxin-antitoxin system RelE/ParE family toxin [Micromonospora sp. C72]MBQ1055568.1 type II toxin-antitoxin system RelE/ParE family toxin [Micromonospora sp. C32]
MLNWPRGSWRLGRLPGRRGAAVDLRPGSVRILFAFDPWRSSILLVAGDKSGRWRTWYQEAIPVAEHRYELYLKDRAREEGKA